MGTRLGLSQFLKFYDFRNLGTCRKQVVVLTMSIQEINKSLNCFDQPGGKPAQDTKFRE